MRLVLVTFAVLVFVFPMTVLGQSAPPSLTGSVPRLIYLSGAFQPIDGQPLRGVETVTVALYTDATGGMPLWQETQSVAVDNTGRYALLLGAASAGGIPPAVLAAGAQWLGTTFDRPGEVESPRVPLTSVPYALRAADADTLGGRPASAYLLASSATSGKGGTSTTGKGSPATTAGQASATSASAGAPSAVVQSGTTNFLAKYVSAADVGNSALYETNGAVGLGTTTPLDLFHVRFTNTVGSVTGLAVQNLGNTATSYSGMLFYDQNGALGQFQGFNNSTHEYRINNIASGGSINFMLGSTSKFFLASNGNIGIGKGSPTATLDVSGTVAVTNDQPATPLQVTSAYTGNTNNDPTTAPTAASFFGATSVGVSGPGAPPAGSRGVLTFGGNGGVASSNGGTGGIGLHAIGGNGGNALNVGGDGGAAILAVGGDSGAGSAIRGGDGGSGITAFGGAGGLDKSGGYGLYAVGGPARTGIGGAGVGAFIAAGTGGTTAAVLEGDVFVQSTGNLSINGNAFKPGGGSWSTLSDERTKKSIEPLRGALDRLLQLRGVTFEYSDPAAFHEQPGQHIGMVTQDVEKVFPTWVDTASDGYERLTFRGFEAVAVEAVRELDSSSKATAARVAELERQNADLRRAVEELSAILKAMQQK
jgi:Chaperone of endosialidase